MPNFQQALDWIRPGNLLTRMAAPTPFLYTFISGPVASDVITVAALTRQRDELVMPYCIFLLMYGHEMLQMAIPSIERDRHHYGKQMEFQRFPSFRNEGGAAPGSTVSMALPFCTTEVIRDGSIVLDMLYQQKLRH